MNPEKLAPLRKVLSEKSTENMNLQRERNKLVVASGLEAGLAQGYFDDLCQAYSESHRHYHTLDHLHQMLQWINEAGVDDTEALWLPGITIMCITPVRKIMKHVAV